MKKVNKLGYFIAVVISIAMITSCSAAIKVPSTPITENKVETTTIESVPIIEPTGVMGPDIEIGNISGFIGVNAEIMNVGNETANVNWSITVTTISGVILTGAKSEGKDLEIPVGQSKKVKSGIILGFGTIEIKVTADIPGDTAEKTANAFVLIVFVLNVS